MSSNNAGFRAPLDEAALRFDVSARAYVLRSIHLILWATFAVFLCVSGARAEVMCGGSDAGYVDLNLTGVSLSGLPAQIYATFTPQNGESLAADASACGFLGFDWQQIVTQYSPALARANSHPLIPLPAPFYDPPPSGYSNAPVGCADGTISQAVNKAYPYYYYPDITGYPGSVGPITDCMALSQNIYQDVLYFFDMPIFPSLSLGQADFETSLVGILPNGTASAPLFSWTWESDYSGGHCLNYFYVVCPGFGGISIGEFADNPILSDTVDGTGGIKVLSVNGVSVPEPFMLQVFVVGLLFIGFLWKNKHPMKRRNFSIRRPLPI